MRSLFDVKVKLYFDKIWKPLETIHIDILEDVFDTYGLSTVKIARILFYPLLVLEYYPHQNDLVFFIYLFIFTELLQIVEKDLVLLLNF